MYIPGPSSLGTKWFLYRVSVQTIPYILIGSQAGRCWYVLNSLSSWISPSARRMEFAVWVAFCTSASKREAMVDWLGFCWYVLICDDIDSYIEYPFGGNTLSHLLVIYIYIHLYFYTMLKEFQIYKYIYIHSHVSTYHTSKPFILRLHCQQAAQLVKPEHHNFCESSCLGW